MVRNLDHRIEAAVPVTDPLIMKEIYDIMNIQLSDNVKARILDSLLLNYYVPSEGKKKVRSQFEIYNYLLKKTRNLKLAAIDIGSNAARLLITEVIEIKNGTPRFNKISLVRVPLRLGMDVFEKGEISKQKTGMILQTMKAYSHLLNVYEVSTRKSVCNQRHARCNKQ